MKKLISTPKVRVLAAYMVIGFWIYVLYNLVIYPSQKSDTNPTITYKDRVKK